MAPFQGMLFTGNVMWAVPLMTPILMAHTGTFTMTECLLIPRSTDMCFARLSMPSPPDPFLPPSLPHTIAPGWDSTYQTTACGYLDTCLLQLTPFCVHLLSPINYLINLIFNIYLLIHLAFIEHLLWTVPMYIEETHRKLSIILVWVD